ncbi:MAG: hypothetical protein L0219_02320, partial [Phycisphaerales bacterium]|nr:hypothetical protein [Phycisphaerales bacterium]
MSTRAGYVKTSAATRAAFCIIALTPTAQLTLDAQVAEGVSPGRRARGLCRRDRWIPRDDRKQLG